MGNYSPMGQDENVQALTWRARRESLLGSTAYWTLLDELSAAGGYDHNFADEAATAILCLLEQQIQVHAGPGRNVCLPAALAELVLGCGGLQAGDAMLDPDDFVFSVAAALSVSDERARVLIRNVFAAVRRRLSEEEIRKVSVLAPPSLRKLWKGGTRERMRE